MKETIKTIILDNQEQDLPAVWPRDLKIPPNSKKIITLSGVRRSGKTYHLFNLIRNLKGKNVVSERILYLNFEDERLDLKTDDLDLILQSYRELYPELDLSKSYFFFDEIQEVKGWEKFINRLYRDVSKHVFITGSNSTLLSKEIATALRGRTITYEIYPLSFSEFVNIKKPGLNFKTSKGRASLANLFNRFFTQGGFPELIGKNKNLREKILQEYFNVMVLRDLVERFDISQVEILKYFCKRVIGNSANEFSAHKIYNELKSQGYKVSKDTIYSYQGYVDAVYLSCFIPKYFYSIIKKELSQKKSYVIDHGMGNAVDFKLNQDKGRVLETIIALELIKKGKQISYMQNGAECDFVVTKKGSIVEALQVTYDLGDDGTKEREFGGLIQTCKKLFLKKGIIVTMDYKDEIFIDGIKINIIPAWEYLYTVI